VTRVHVVVPSGIDDPDRPSGGNAYDRQICSGLAAAGWDVCEYAVAGAWPWPDTAALASLGGVTARLPDGEVVLVDGLIASTVPSVLTPVARRMRLVVLVHLPLGDRPAGHVVPDARARERAVLSAAAAVVTTSRWTRDRLLEWYALAAERVHVAEPGVDPAGLATGTPAGGALLSVAAVTAHKGHDVMLSALAALADLAWTWTCVGPLDREPDFVAGLRRRARQHGVEHRVDLTGPRTGPDLARAYAAADLVVLGSRAESYGMVATEALARGLPVVASDVGGLADALGRTRDGHRPGLLVPPEDPVALADALRSWLTDPVLRHDLRAAARERRRALPRWSSTVARVADALTEAGR
jgi:glycosyltransferase involved in cell wall biosynthesis